MQPQYCIHKISTKIIHVTVLEITVYMYILFTELNLQASLSYFMAWSSVIMMLADACIFLLMEESHLAVGGCVYIEFPARKMALSHTYM